MIGCADSKKCDTDDENERTVFVDDDNNSRDGTIKRHMSGRRPRKDSEEKEVLIVAAVSSSATTAPLLEKTLPLPLSATLAAAYVLSSMLFFLTIRYTKKKRLHYNDTLVVFGIELTKLIVSVALKYFEDGEFLPATVLLSRERWAIWRGGLSYAVPSLLYVVYNNLTFLNLSLVHVNTYQVFMQTRILITAFFSTLVLKQVLTVRKWSALVLLMIGLASKYYSPNTLQVNKYVLSILLQALLSSVAGVYNEYVLKKELLLSIHQQNFFMYLYSILFNAVFGLIGNSVIVTNLLGTKTLVSYATAHPMETDTSVSVYQTGTPLVMLLIFFGAVTGLSAAFILKFINVIVKALASAVEVVLAAICAALLLGEALTAHDIIAACIVMISVYMYYTQSNRDLRTFSRQPSRI
ncbi:hypothetical protein JKF63_06123 [Porcisia hertigi]|uniref:Uncharacterized protein n=1 Tax=Porcisia hertigi TaxID=2761500 RepID=A0A836IBQ1_9TRYP|nr:hypothetical protein JKF63_06123 [Porcisia hertigi]